MPPTPRSVQPGKLRWLWLTLALCGVAALSASAGALLAVAIAGNSLMQSHLSTEESEVFTKDEISTGINFRLPKLTRPVNILVLGVKVLSTDVSNPPPETRDLGYHATINSLEGLSDSMLLIRFNPGMQQVTVLSLPRDTRTYVDGAGITKINEANALGGPALAARSTSDLLGGVGVDRYVRINVQGVEKLIDALGGIKVYVPQDMKYQDDSQHLYINLKQGEQRLNGSQAVQFLRFRYDAYGDIGRVQRQQTFLRAMREQALQPATLTRLPQILSVIQSNLDTNLNVEELIALAGFASQIERSNMQMLMLPGTFSNAGEYEASYWLPNQAQIEMMVRQYFGLTSPSFAKTEALDHTTIAIQNSAENTEIAIETVEKLIETLSGAGYGDIFMDEPWNEPLATTRIIAQQGDIDKARAIQSALGFGEVLVESTGSLQSDITIRLGTDAIQEVADSEAAVIPPASPRSTPGLVQPSPQPAPQPTLEPAPPLEPEATEDANPTLVPDPAEPSLEAAPYPTSLEETQAPLEAEALPADEIPLELPLQPPE
jgi:LCP family protein required for cell wall assembly